MTDIAPVVLGLMFLFVNSIVAGAMGVGGCSSPRCAGIGLAAIGLWRAFR